MSYISASSFLKSLHVHGGKKEMEIVRNEADKANIKKKGTRHYWDPQMSGIKSAVLDAIKATSVKPYRVGVALSKRKPRTPSRQPTAPKDRSAVSVLITIEYGSTGSLTLSAPEAREVHSQLSKVFA
jgi:hypothetical protein